VTDPVRHPTILARVLGGLWLGAGAFILIVAPAVFAAAGTPTSAANVVGAILSRWHYISLLAPAILLLMEWRSARGRIVAVLFAGVLLAASQAMVDVRIRQIRAESPVPVSSLARTDPVRRRFGMLHGVSSLLLVAQVLAAVALLAMDRDA
jgi:hypothetical protein